MLPLRQKSITETVFVVSLLCINALILFKAVTAPVIEFDTQRLAAAIPELRRCLTGESAGCKDISYFAPIQQVPALILHWLGATFDQTLLLLAWITTAAVVLIQIPLMRRFARGERVAALFFAVTVLSGPALPYLTSTFSEGLVLALLTGIIMTFAGGGHPLLTFTLFFFVAMSKDTAPLWCIFVALAMWLMTRSTGKRSVQNLIAGLSGAAAGLLIITGLNVLRYDSLFNTFHSQPAFMAESFRQVLLQLAAMFVSPNGGLFWFWPVPLLLLMFSGTNVLRSEADRSFLIPVVLLAGGLILSLSLFYTPFGWVSWGARLSLPWFFAAGLMIVIAGGDLITMKRPAITWAIAAAAALWQLPHAFAALSTKVIMSVFRPTTTCPDMVSVLADKKQNTICINGYFWPEGPSVLFESWKIVRPDPFEIFFSLAAVTVTATGVFLFFTPARLPDGNS